jgi:putative ABC transport system substrate-binding protein
MLARPHVGSEASLLMRRREFIAGFGAAAAWPVATIAGDPGPRRVGILMNSVATDTEYQSWLAGFIDRLRQLGWTDGQNLRLDVRWSASDIRLARAHAAELVGLKPDVMLVATTFNLTVMQETTNTLPVVFVQVADPVKQGFVTNFRHPGGNLTGFSLFEFSVGSKWLDLLKEVVPTLTLAAVMFDPDTGPQNKFFIPAIQAVAPGMSMEVISTSVRSIADIELALDNLAHQPNSGLILLPDLFLHIHASLIADLAIRHRLPAIGTSLSFAKVGGLMAYGNTESVANQYRQAAIYVDLILKGSKPGDLPVQVADQYTFAVNLKTAKSLGVTVPSVLLIAADEVID